MESYDTLTEAINSLKKQGYTVDFNIKENWIECIEGNHIISRKKCKTNIDELLWQICRKQHQ